MSMVSPNGDVHDELRRARIVIENLQVRVGTLIGENLDLLVRLHDYEVAQQQTPEQVEPQAERTRADTAIP